MNSLKIASALVALLMTLATVRAEIGADLLSTLKIVGKLCYVPGDHSDPIAQKFFGCYDGVSAEDKAKYVECQESTFGNPMDTEDHIDTACRKPYLLVSYATCLKKAYAGNDEQMEAATLIVNKCQGAIFGMA